MINKYPYSDMHELNADWLLAKVAELEGRVKDIEDGDSSAVTDLVPSFNSGRKLADFELDGQTGAIYEPVDVLPELVDAGYHNSIYRGKFLGNSISDEQYARMASGTFEDMFVGDYWTLPITLNGVTSNRDFIIAGFDYWWNVGDSFPQGSNKHHIVMVPRETLYNARMNATNTSSGGYVGSEMYTTNLSEARTAIGSTFSGHIYSVRRLLSNSIDASGQANGWVWSISDIDLLNEVMIYGMRVWGKSPYDIGVDASMLPLFNLNPASRNIREYYWLSSIASSTNFSAVNLYARVSFDSPSNSLGVRPCFAIYGGN